MSDVDPQHPTGAQALVRTLEDLGVRLVFGLPGVHNLEIWNALGTSAIRLVGVRHEQAAVYAADGYARATGRLGVALVTTGPGAANTLGATGEARASGSPVLVIATDIPAALRRPGVYRGVLHETRDQQAMFVPVTKHALTVTRAGEIADAVSRCGRDACGSPTGPVYLGIPTDLLAQRAAPHGAAPAVQVDTVDDPAKLARAAGLLRQARRPLIWAGGGALRSGAGAAVAELAVRLDAPVVLTHMARGLLPAGHPHLAPGPVHEPSVGALWDEADVVLAIGTDFDGMMTQNWLMPAPKALISINIDAAEASKNYVSDLTLTGDARILGERLCGALPEAVDDPATPGRLQEVAGRVRTAVTEYEPEATRLLDAMARTLPDDANVVVDMCIPGYWLGGYHQVARARRFAYPVGWGTLGFAFPAAIGTALAQTGPTVCVVGDGGFLFACGELATVAQERVPLTVVLVDDGGYGMLRFDQAQRGGELIGTDLHTPNFPELARAFGVGAETVEGFGEAFEAALASAIGSGAPQLIVVKARLKPPLTTSVRWYRRDPQPAL